MEPGEGETTEHAEKASKDEKLDDAARGDKNSTRSDQQKSPAADESGEVSGMTRDKGEGECHPIANPAASPVSEDNARRSSSDDKDSVVLPSTDNAAESHRLPPDGTAALTTEPASSVVVRSQSPTNEATQADAGPVGRGTAEGQLPFDDTLVSEIERGTGEVSDNQASADDSQLVAEPLNCHVEDSQLPTADALAAVPHPAGEETAKDHMFTQDTATTAMEIPDGEVAEGELPQHKARSTAAELTSKEVTGALPPPLNETVIMPSAEPTSEEVVEGQLPVNENLAAAAVAKLAREEVAGTQLPAEKPLEAMHSSAKEDGARSQLPQDDAITAAAEGETEQDIKSHQSLDENLAAPPARPTSPKVAKDCLRPDDIPPAEPQGDEVAKGQFPSDEDALSEHAMKELSEFLPFPETESMAEARLPGNESPTMAEEQASEELTGALLPSCETPVAAFVVPNEGVTEGQLPSGEISVAAAEAASEEVIEGRFPSDGSPMTVGEVEREYVTESWTSTGKTLAAEPANSEFVEARAATDHTPIRAAESTNEDVTESQPLLDEPAGKGVTEDRSHQNEIKASEQLSEAMAEDRMYAHRTRAAEPSGEESVEGQVSGDKASVAAQLANETIAEGRLTADEDQVTASKSSGDDGTGSPLPQDEPTTADASIGEISNGQTPENATPSAQSANETMAKTSIATEIPTATVEPDNEEIPEGRLLADETLAEATKPASVEVHEGLLSQDRTANVESINEETFKGQIAECDALAAGLGSKEVNPSRIQAAANRAAVESAYEEVSGSQSPIDETMVAAAQPPNEELKEDSLSIDGNSPFNPGNEEIPVGQVQANEMLAAAKSAAEGVIEDQPHHTSLLVAARSPGKEDADSHLHQSEASAAMSRNEAVSGNQISVHETFTTERTGETVAEVAIPAQVPFADAESTTEGVTEGQPLAAEAPIGASKAASGGIAGDHMLPDDTSAARPSVKKVMTIDRLPIGETSAISAATDQASEGVAKERLPQRGTLVGKSASWEAFEGQIPADDASTAAKSQDDTTVDETASRDIVEGQTTRDSLSSAAESSSEETTDGHLRDDVAPAAAADAASEKVMEMNSPANETSAAETPIKDIDEGQTSSGDTPAAVGSANEEVTWLPEDETAVAAAEPAEEANVERRLAQDASLAAEPAGEEMADAKMSADEVLAAEEQPSENATDSSLHVGEIRVMTADPAGGEVTDEHLPPADSPAAEPECEGMPEGHMPANAKPAAAESANREVAPGQSSNDAPADVAETENEVNVLGDTTADDILIAKSAGAQIAEGQIIPGDSALTSESASEAVPVDGTAVTDVASEEIGDGQMSADDNPAADNPAAAESANEKLAECRMKVTDSSVTAYEPATDEVTDQHFPLGNTAGGSKMPEGYVLANGISAAAELANEEAADSWSPAGAAADAAEAESEMHAEGDTAEDETPIAESAGAQIVEDRTTPWDNAQWAMPAGDETAVDGTPAAEVASGEISDGQSSGDDVPAAADSASEEATDGRLHAIDHPAVAAEPPPATDEVSDRHLPQRDTPAAEPESEEIAEGNSPLQEASAARPASEYSSEAQISASDTTTVEIGSKTLSEARVPLMAMSETAVVSASEEVAKSPMDEMPVAAAEPASKGKEDNLPTNDTSTETTGERNFEGYLPASETPAAAAALASTDPLKVHFPQDETPASESAGEEISEDRMSACQTPAAEPQDDGVFVSQLTPHESPSAASDSASVEVSEGRLLPDETTNPSAERGSEVATDVQLPLIASEVESSGDHSSASERGHPNFTSGTRLLREAVAGLSQTDGIVEETTKRDEIRAESTAENDATTDNPKAEDADPHKPGVFRPALDQSELSETVDFEETGLSQSHNIKDAPQKVGKASPDQQHNDAAPASQHTDLNLSDTAAGRTMAVLASNADSGIRDPSGHDERPGDLRVTDDTAAAGSIAPKEPEADGVLVLDPPELAIYDSIQADSAEADLTSPESVAANEPSNDDKAAKEQSGASSPDTQSNVNASVADTSETTNAVVTGLELADDKNDLGEDADATRPTSPSTGAGDDQLEESNASTALPTTEDSNGVEQPAVDLAGETADAQQEASDATPSTSETGIALVTRAEPDKEAADLQSRATASFLSQESAAAEDRVTEQDSAPSEEAVSASVPSVDAAVDPADNVNAVTTSAETSPDEQVGSTSPEPQDDYGLQPDVGDAALADVGMATSKNAVSTGPPTPSEALERQPMDEAATEGLESVEQSTSIQKSRENVAAADTHAESKADDASRPTDWNSNDPEPAVAPVETEATVSCTDDSETTKRGDVTAELPKENDATADHSETEDTEQDETAAADEERHGFVDEDAFDNQLVIDKYTSLEHLRSKQVLPDKNVADEILPADNPKGDQVSAEAVTEANSRRNVHEDDAGTARLAHVPGDKDPEQESQPQAEVHSDESWSSRNASDNEDNVDDTSAAPSGDTRAVNRNGEALSNAIELVNSGTPACFVADPVPPARHSAVSSSSKRSIPLHAPSPKAAALALLPPPQVSASEQTDWYLQKTSVSNLTEENPTYVIVDDSNAGGIEKWMRGRHYAPAHHGPLAHAAIAPVPPSRPRTKGRHDVDHVHPWHEHPAASINDLQGYPEHGQSTASRTAQQYRSTSHGQHTHANHLIRKDEAFVRFVNNRKDVRALVGLLGNEHAHWHSSESSHHHPLGPHPPHSRRSMHRPSDMGAPSSEAQLRRSVAPMVPADSGSGLQHKVREPQPPASPRPQESARLFHKRVEFKTPTPPSQPRPRTAEGVAQSRYVVNRLTRTADGLRPRSQTTHGELSTSGGVGHLPRLVAPAASSLHSTTYTEQTDRRKDYYKEELKRLQRGIEKEAERIKAYQLSNSHTELGNGLEPYCDTTDIVQAIEEVKDKRPLTSYKLLQCSSRPTALGLVDPWINLRMDGMLLPKIPTKERFVLQDLLKKSKSERVNEQSVRNRQRVLLDHRRPTGKRHGRLLAGEYCSKSESRDTDTGRSVLIKLPMTSEQTDSSAHSGGEAADDTELLVAEDEDALRCSPDSGNGESDHQASHPRDLDSGAVSH